MRNVYEFEMTFVIYLTFMHINITNGLDRKIQVSLKLRKYFNKAIPYKNLSTVDQSYH